MADDKPENTNGRGGPEGQRRDGHGGRRKGFRPRHGSRDGAPRDNSGQGGSSRASLSEGPASDSGRLEAQRSPARPEEARVMPACPICGKPVYDLSTALAASREAPEPAHFDCVLDRVTASETLAPGEKIVYLGSGSFGVVVFKDKSESSFTVLRRVQWEKEGEKKDWRRGLSSKITAI
jgi:hypothetical protein